MVGFMAGEIPVEKVLTAAQEAKLSVVFILGYEPDGTAYLASSVQDTDVLRDLLDEGMDLLSVLEQQENDDEDDEDLED
jgi:hypothetical protein